MVVSPSDGASLFVDLAEGLGRRVAPGLGRSSAWRALCDAARLCRAQELHVVLAIDGSQSLNEPAYRLDLERLYLWTPSSEAFYARLGWTTIETMRSCGYDIAVMHRSLRP